MYFLLADLPIEQRSKILQANLNQTRNSLIGNEKQFEIAFRRIQTSAHKVRPCL